MAEENSPKPDEQVTPSRIDHKEPATGRGIGGVGEDSELLHRPRDDDAWWHTEDLLGELNGGE